MLEPVFQDSVFYFSYSLPPNRRTSSLLHNSFFFLAQYWFWENLSSLAIMNYNSLRRCVISSLSVQGHFSLSKPV